MGETAPEGEPWSTRPAPRRERSSSTATARWSTTCRSTASRPSSDRSTAPGRLSGGCGRSTGIAVGVVTHQSGVARGLLTTEDVAAVNARVEELLGPFDTWQVCPHDPQDGCGCRTPATGLVAAAARELAVPVAAVTVIGAHLAGVEAGRAAGAVGVLVPRPTTARADVERAPVVAGDLAAALDLLGI